MLLEAGEVDLAKVLNQRLMKQPTIHGGSSSNNAAATMVMPPQLDPFFSRMVWREMLEAVEHIHQHRIVHGKDFIHTVLAVLLFVFLG
jgi:hypothetical protein